MTRKRVKKKRIETYFALINKQRVLLECIEVWGYHKEWHKKERIPLLYYTEVADV
jgi:hypothetical protein